MTASLDTRDDATADEAPSEHTGRSWRDRTSSQWLWAVVLPLIVVTMAGAIRFHQLGQPERCYFDETYYYYDARDYLSVGTETSFAVHPPVGKWLIAIGVATFGVDEGSPIDAAVTEEPDGCVVRDGEEDNPAARAREAEEAFARRVMSALFGTGAVAVAYFVGLRLFRRRSTALLGATLLAVDGLAVTMSRISMLDIFLQFFVLLGVLALLIDRDRLWDGAPDFVPDEPPDTPPDRDRKWLWAAGLFLGLAVATKWSGLAPLGLAWAFVAFSELAWRRRWTGSPWPDLVRGVSRAILASCSSRSWSTSRPTRAGSPTSRTPARPTAATSSRRPRRRRTPMTPPPSPTCPVTTPNRAATASWSPSRRSRGAGGRSRPRSSASTATSRPNIPTAHPRRRGR